MVKVNVEGLCRAGLEDKGGGLAVPVPSRSLFTSGRAIRGTGEPEQCVCVSVRVTI